MRIAVAQFMHETVTFLKNDTTREDFIYEGSPLQGEELLQSGAKSYMAGFVQVAREFSDVELLGISSPMFPKTGTGSAWITADAYEWFAETMLSELLAAGPIDGVHLVLHGGMAVRGIARPEADLAGRIRRVIGSKPFIGATFDPHGNEDEHFLQVADLAFCAKYYPHYDEFLQGNRAARSIVRAIRGNFRPAHATCKVPILTPTVAQCTDTGPWAELVRRSLIWEARHPDLYVNLFFGFPWADAVDAGMTVQAISNDDADLAASAVRSLAEYAWRMRSELVSAATICSIRDGVARARRSTEARLVVIADHSDRSGRATWVLSEVIAQDLSRTIIGTITDRAVTEQLIRMGAKPGDAFDMDVGGGIEASDGQPVRIRGQILSIVQMNQRAEGCGQNSPWVCVGFGKGNVLVITPFITQILEPQVFSECLGINLANFRVIVVKSRVHFRRGFVDTGYAESVFIVEPDQAFLGTTRLRALPYEHLRIEGYYPYGCDEFQPKLILNRAHALRGGS